MTVATSRGAAGIPRVGSAVLMHGFTRGPQHLAALSDALTAHGVATVRPALSAWLWKRSNNNASHLADLAERLTRGLPDGPVAVVGHSAGAAAGAWLAAQLLDRQVDVTQVVFVDGVENPTHLIERAWPRLGAVGIAAVVAEPSRCNRDGQLARWLRQQDRPLTIVDIPGSGHGDIEMSPSAVYRYACGDASDEEIRQRVLDTVVRLTLEGLTAVTPDR